MILVLVPVPEALVPDYMDVIDLKLALEFRGLRLSSCACPRTILGPVFPLFQVLIQRHEMFDLTIMMFID